MQSIEINEDYRPLGGVVEADNEGTRLDAYLARAFPFHSRAEWQKRVRDGELLVAGNKVRPSYRLQRGQSLFYFHPNRVEPDVDRHLELLYCQAGVMAVAKPGRLPMHENGAYRKNTFATLVKEQFGEEWSAVHRLDRETSGIVLCAATHDLRSKLAIALQERKTRKQYLALVRGIPVAETWQCCEPIGKPIDSKIRIKMWVNFNDGLQAETRFRKLYSSQEHSLVLARPITGRTNQIRVHLAYHGHPIVGDKMYHEDEDVFLKYFEEGDVAEVHEATGFRRHCLHAFRLGFIHPESGKEEHVTCPMPDDMQQISQELGVETELSGVPD